jgi:nucleoside-diphosphate-sugar epimerase
MVRFEEILIRDTSTIREAMRSIDRSGLRMAVVVDSNNKLKGIITDGDIRRGIINGASISECVSSVMNNNPHFVTNKMNPSEAVQLVQLRKLIGVPLIDEAGKVNDFVSLKGGRLNYLSREELQIKPVNKVLIIGGAGYIGSILVRKLLEKNYKVKVLDIFLYGKDSLAGINDPRLEVVEGDTRHVESLTSCIKDVDAVIHLAELVGDPACALNPKITQDINYLATQLVAAVCRHYQVNRLIYLSSCSVYGASESEDLLTEESEVNPVSLYAKMKLNSEAALREMANDNFSPTILRLSTVYGFSYRPRFDLVVNTLTAKAVSEGKITIFGGDQWRPNVHVKDVSKAISMILEMPLDKVSGQIFNVGSEGQNYTINQLGELVKKEIPSASVIFDPRNVDKRNYKVSFEKIRNLVGFVPEVQLHEGIKEVAEAFHSGKVNDHNLPVYSNVKFLQDGIPERN